MKRRVLFALATSAIMQPVFMAGTLRYWSLLHSCPVSAAGPEVIAAAAGVGCIAWMTAFYSVYKPAPEEWSRKSQFSYPTVSKDLLHRKPCGIFFGKDKRSGKYVCKDTSERGIAHELIIGGSGSGKSSALIIPTLLVNREKTIVCIDIKGELGYKTTLYKESGPDGHICIVNPNDRSMCGYDPLYELNALKEPSTQQIVSVWQQIAVCLVSKNPGEKDPFWADSARNLCQGLGIYYYRRGSHEFIDIIDRILGAPITEQIMTALADAKPTSPEYRFLVQFGDLTDDKGKVTLGTVFSNLSNNLTLFANDADLRYWLKTNPNRVTPYTVFRDRKSVFITLREEKLEVYAGLVKLMVDQMLREAERQPDISGGSGENILFVLDELPRILQGGKLTSLLSGTKTLRSKGVILVMVSQSVSALQQAYSRDEVADLINNCEYIAVLSAKDPTTAKMVAAWCGKYLERSVTYQTGKTTSNSTSYAEKNNLTEADLLTLQDSGEMILVSPHGWNRIKKAPWFADKNLREISQKLQSENDIFNKERMKGE